MESRLALPTLTSVPKQEAVNSVVEDATAFSSTVVPQPEAVKPVTEDAAWSYSFPHEDSWMG